MIAVLLAPLVQPLEARANSRDRKWKTLETEHFYIHYAAGTEEAAARAAMLAERAYSRITVDLGHAIFLKVHVRMIDDTDGANGNATAAPFPRINAFVTAPDSMSVLETYDDWLDILLTHEFVHVVHLDTVHGVARVVNALLGFGVLGKVWMPNIVQPWFFVEGLATYEESRLTSGGRHRSAQFDTMLRMHVLEQGFMSLPRVASDANVFPYGTVRYLYGLHLLHYIGSHYGHDKIRELSHTFAGQTIPYGIGRALKKVIGVDLEQLWREFEFDTTRRFQDQARRIRARGVREGRRLTFSPSNAASSQFTRHPFWSPDDQHIYFYEDDGQMNPGLRRIKATGGRMREGLGIGRQGMNLDVETVIQLQQAGSGSFIAGSSDMVFEVAFTQDFRYSWNDLYRWRAPNPNHLDRLTTGMRARDPHVSPDGHTVVFSRNDVAQSRLAFLDLDTLDVTDVAPKGRIAQVFSPRWAPDGERVAYSGWYEGGYRDIFVYDRRTGETERITADRFLDTEPSWTPDGRFILFSSDRDEIFNVYAYELETKHVWQVTNTLGGAYEPVPSNDGTRVAYLSTSAYGYDLWVMALDPAEFFEPMPVTPPMPDIDDPTPALAEDQGRSGVRYSWKSRRYMPIRTMFPRLISPTTVAYQGSAGNPTVGAVLGIQTGVSDVLNFHRVSADFAQYLDQRQSTGGVGYSFSQFLPSFSVGFSRRFGVPEAGYTRYDYDHPDGDGATYQLGRYRERTTRGSLGVSVPVLRHPIHNADVSLTYSFSRIANLDAGTGPIDPNAPATAQTSLVGDLGQLELSVAYSNARSVRQAYANETGRTLRLRVYLIDPHLGGQYGDVQATATYIEYLRMPWRGHQSLALRLSGGASAGGLGQRAPFRIGGFSQQPDLVTTLINYSGATNYDGGALQGYAPSSYSGLYYSVFNASYRIPIADFERGLGAVPVFLRKLTLAPFSDVGAAWTDRFTKDVIKVGAGAALVFTFKIGYLATANLFLSYAHGFDKEKGLDTFVSAFGSSF
ncbi:MAG: hypothetical protein R3B09_32070 [Nannocystaceae bacterium]